jgi:hypothetical protein
MWNTHEKVGPVYLPTPDLRGIDGEKQKKLLVTGQLLKDIIEEKTYLQFIYESRVRNIKILIQKPEEQEKAIRGIREEYQKKIGASNRYIARVEAYLAKLRSDLAEKPAVGGDLIQLYKQDVPESAALEKFDSFLRSKAARKHIGNFEVLEGDTPLKPHQMSLATYAKVMKAVEEALKNYLPIQARREGMSVVDVKVRIEGESALVILKNPLSTKPIAMSWGMEKGPVFIYEVSLSGK